MRADVPIGIDHHDHQAHRLPSAAVALDAPVVASVGPSKEAPGVAVVSWGAQTVFGDLAQTWERLLRGDHVDDHVRLQTAGNRPRALTLARSSTSGFHVDADAAVIVGTSKGD